MAIKFRVINNQQEFRYVRCLVQSFTPLSLVWLPESDKHRESVAYKGAPNEQQLLEIDSTIPDDLVEDWCKVVGVITGQDSQGNDIIEYHVELDTVKRDDWYKAELRSRRDQLIRESIWMYERHKMEIDGSIVPSLTTLQFDDLVSYIQLLRDWPNAETDIYARTEPTKPAWI